MPQDFPSVGAFVRGAFPWDQHLPGAEFFDRDVYVRLDDDRRVRLTLTEPASVGGEFVGFRARVLSKRTGTIDERRFDFDQYLDHRDRTDGREKDYPLSGGETFVVIPHCGWGWYIARPRSTEPFVRAVADWIALFR